MHAASLPSGCLRLSLSPSIIVDSISGVIPAHNLNHPTHGMDRSKYTNLGRESWPRWFEQLSPFR